MMLLSFLVQKGDEFFWKLLKLFVAVLSYSALMLMLWVNI